MRLFGGECFTKIINMKNKTFILDTQTLQKKARWPVVSDNTLRNVKFASKKMCWSTGVK